MKNSLENIGLHGKVDNLNEKTQKTIKASLFLVLIPNISFGSESGAISSIPHTYNHITPDTTLEEKKSPADYILNHRNVQNKLKSLGYSLDEVDVHDVGDGAYIIYEKENSYPVRIIADNMAKQIPIELKPDSPENIKNVYKAVARIEGYDVVLEDGHLKLFTWEDKSRGEQIDIFSKEFVEAFDMMYFLVNRFRVHIFEQPPANIISTLNKQGYLRIKDLLKFKDSLDSRQFEKELNMANYWLIFQVQDERFDKAGDPVTKEELDYYLEEGYINRMLYERVVDKL